MLGSRRREAVKLSVVNRKNIRVLYTSTRLSLGSPVIQAAFTSTQTDLLLFRDSQVSRSPSFMHTIADLNQRPTC